MATDAPITTPADIFRLGSMYAMSKVVLTAVELDLFTALQDADATAEEVCERLGLHPRATRQWLDTLVVTGLLRRENGRYGNSEAATRFLVRGAPAYVGGFLSRSGEMLYPAWGRLTDTLRTGLPQANDGDFRELVDNPAFLDRFLTMMDSLSGHLGPELAKSYDWTAHDSVADIGGARGNLVSHLVRAHVHLKGMVFDLPQMEPRFDAHLAELGLSGRASFVPGDFFNDPLPQADVLIMGHVLHDWSEEERRMLVGKAYQALAPGGVLLVYDRMIEDEPTDADNLVVSLHMILTTTDGAEYTQGECLAWLREAGFRQTSVQPLGPTDSLVIATK
ncbi:methyltransferase [Nonomuraea cavernae]|uniref:O-methyltransferase n=1 Tax=Nonomuraea cavernae TaxID=2045107 RepID=A0A918DTS5_9ACTN|nr:methyltransferase [Nonomuraea cavernae]MCA2189477.1 acetylserotonin O-methyltransferase [Nonomuraea cavernae]GGO82153.1 O-methyltransferase [Nonomuraea cavernae]